MKIALTNEFKQAIPLLLHLKEHGFQAYFVGGSVRDVLLHRSKHDVDITTDAKPNEMKAIFKTANHYSGEKHGTVLIFFAGSNYEVTTFRIDGQYLDNRHPETVSFTKNLQDDLSRRDFTINAFAVNEEGELFDYFDGLNDLKNHIIKTVGQAETRFSEDALRILRAFRFSSQLNFEIEEKTLLAGAKIKNNLADIAVERIFSEFSKLLSGDNPSKSLKQMLLLGITDYLPGHQLINDPSALFTGFTGIQSTIDAINWTRFVWFSHLRGEKLNQYLDCWKMSNHLKTQIIKSVNFLSKKTVDNLDLFTIGSDIAIALSAISRPDQNELKQRYEKLIIHEVSELQITGFDLKKIGIPSGPIFGKIIRNLRKKVILEQLANQKTVLIQEAKNDFSNLGTIKK
ncbi:CCA tRNA nucleotidyltransferase [Oenococcus sicerae]|uniref:CCA tRNA nucleotidyltransferase n=1 Tax=Oenococcus sicerae TaxID=2203724 RepID=UPI0039E91F2B